MQFISLETLAMKPAPFDKKVTRKDPNSSYYLVSYLEGNKESQSGSGQTIMKSRWGFKQWEFQQYVGRHLVSISPDGKGMVLYGDYHFGSMIKVDADTVMARAITQGTEVKVVRFKDIYSKPAEQVVQSLNISVMGGGWVPWDKLIKSFRVDWTADLIQFELHDSTVLNISLKESREN